MDNKEQDLNFENEFLKLKLIAESGAHISANNLPPQVENDFLKYIMEFEKAAGEKRMIKLFDKIQRPDFPINVDDDSLPSELEKLLKHLEQHHIKVTSLCEVSDRELYRFIVEDLFEETIDDIPDIEGGYCCFIYEDFYPNHRYDIENRLEDLLRLLIKKEGDIYNWLLSSEFISVSGTKLTENQVLEHLHDFFDQYQSIEIPVFEKKELTIEESKAVQTVCLKMEMRTGEGSGLHIFEGDGNISFENTDGWWSVSGIDIPGLRI